MTEWHKLAIAELCDAGGLERAARTRPARGRFEWNVTLPVDPDLERFVRDHFRSVWSVEVLLLIKSRPEHIWGASEINKALRASQMAVDGGLRDLERAGLLIRDPGGGGRYAPQDERLADLVERLATAYRESPVSLINLITRARSAQDFANAFKFRGP